MELPKLDGVGMYVWSDFDSPFPEARTFFPKGPRVFREGSKVFPREIKVFSGGVKSFSIGTCNKQGPQFFFYASPCREVKGFLPERSRVA